MSYEDPLERARAAVEAARHVAYDAKRDAVQRLDLIERIRAERSDLTRAQETLAATIGALDAAKRELEYASAESSQNRAELDRLVVDCFSLLDVVDPANGADAAADRDEPLTLERLLRRLEAWQQRYAKTLAPS